MSEISYSFAEFCDHRAALDYVLAYDHVTLSDGDNVELTEHEFGSNALRVMDYMRQLYPAAPESFFKGSRFLMIHLHIATHIKAFEDAGLAVIGDQGTSLVHPKAWRALHHFHVTLPVPAQGKISNAEVIAYAQTLPDEGAG